MEINRIPRIIVAEFHQETNSFNPQEWSFEQFRQDTFLEGPAVIEKYRSTPGSVLNGMFHVADRYHAQLIPACALRSSNGGRVDQAVIDYFLDSLLRCWNNCKSVDAIFLSLHAATQSTQHDDACGYLIKQLRQTIGPDVVITVGCDMHGNITQDFMENSDFICGYQTYPHIDQFETGMRAAELAFAKLNQGETSYVARAEIPMIVPASGYSTDHGPFREIMELGHTMVSQGELKDFSVFQMQPWLDVAPGCSTVLTAATDPETAKRSALRLANQVYENRDKFWPDLYSIDQVINIAMSAPEGKPVILVDFADSVGGGAMGDSAAVVLRLLARGCPVRCATMVTDREAALQAEQVGVGNTATFFVGAKLSPGMAGPAELTATVRSIHDGLFRQAGPAAKGMLRKLGKTAVLSAENMDILACEHLCGTGDIQIYRHFGIEPTEYQLIVVKANTSFRAAYEPIAHKICMADTPGIGASNLKDLPYSRIPDSFYPFVHMDNYTIADPGVYLR